MTSSSKPRGIVLFALAIGVAPAATPARAATFDRVRSCVARFGKVAVVDRLIANFEHREFTFRESGGDPFRLRLGRSLGNGLSAQVYVVESLEGLASGALNDHPRVVKMAHSLRFRTEPRALAMKNGALVREYEVRHVLDTEADLLWADPVMQAKRDRWVEGRVPVCPIDRIVRTDEGVLLFKPLVRGKSLAQIFRDAGGRIENVPREMIDSAGDLFDMAQALRRRVIVPGSKPGDAGRPFTADLKPENYMWVSDPAEFATYGLRRPGFVFVEMTHFAKVPRWTYDEAHMSREEYQGIFLKYVEALGRAKGD